MFRRRRDSINAQKHGPTFSPQSKAYMRALLEYIELEGSLLTTLLPSCINLFDTGMLLLPHARLIRYLDFVSNHQENIGSFQNFVLDPSHPVAS